LIVLGIESGGLFVVFFLVI